MRLSDSNSPRDFVPSTTDLYSLETSFAELASRHKYHIVGAVVGAILAAVVIALLWKCNILSKFRVFDKKIEDDKRKSLRG